MAKKYFKRVDEDNISKQGFLNIFLDDFARWILYDPQPLTDEDKPILNLYLADYDKRCYELFGMLRTKIVRDLKEYPELLEEYTALTELLSEKLVKHAMQGDIKDTISKFYLQARFNWTEKIETHNTNENVSIVWNETRTYKKKDQVIELGEAEEIITIDMEKETPIPIKKEEENK